MPRLRSGARRAVEQRLEHLGAHRCMSARRRAGRDDKRPVNSREGPCPTAWERKPHYAFSKGPAPTPTLKEEAMNNENSGTPGVVAVGIDGSAGSRAALSWAAAEARLRGTPLRVVHAWTFSYPPGAGYGVLGPSVDNVSGGLMSDMRRAGEALLERAIGELPPEVDSAEIDPQ